jgi:hypothetical protein
VTYLTAFVDAVVIWSGWGVVEVCGNHPWKCPPDLTFKFRHPVSELIFAWEIKCHQDEPLTVLTFQKETR